MFLHQSVWFAILSPLLLTLSFLTKKLCWLLYCWKKGIILNFLNKMVKNFCKYRCTIQYCTYCTATTNMNYSMNEPLLKNSIVKNYKMFQCQHFGKKGIFSSTFDNIFTCYCIGCIDKPLDIICITVLYNDKEDCLIVG